MGHGFNIFGAGFVSVTGAPPPPDTIVECRGRPSPASAPRPIQIFFANINVWGKKASDFFLDPGFQDSVGCFVEHHLDSDGLITVKKKFHNIGRDCYASAATSTGRSATGTSAGAAIAPFKTLCMRSLDRCLLEHILGTDPNSESRWQAAILRVKGASVLVITTYLVHTIGLTGDNITLLEQLLTLIRCLGLPTIISGDWQMPPKDLVDSDWPRRANLVLALPPGLEATCNLGTERQSYLDYFFVSPQLHPLVSITPYLLAPWKTHVSLRLTLQSRPQSFLAPTLMLPRQLPPLPLLDGDHVLLPEVWDRAVLLTDTLIKRRAPATGVFGLEEKQFQKLPHAQRKISADYAKASTQAEVYTCLAAGIGEQDLSQYIGRGHMPRVRLRPPFRKTYGHSTFACPKCDTWARIEAALSLLTRAAALHRSTLNTIVVALKNLSNGVDRYWAKLKKHNCPRQAWISWFAALSSTAVLESHVGYTSERCHTWLQRALAQKQNAIQVRVKNCRSNFKDWLRTALEKGAGAAHDFVKEQTPYAAVSPFSLDKVFSTWGHLWKDKLAEEPIGDPRILVRSHIPWSVQKDQCIDSICANATMDNEYFQNHAGYDPVADVIDFGIDEFVQAVQKYSTKKKCGIDLWVTAELRKLPRDILLFFSKVVTSVQRSTMWPIQVLMCLGSLIPKALGGQRPISKTPLLYRLWCIIRNDTMQCWNEAHCPPWDTASKGHSAETAACGRLWLFEAAHVAGYHAAGNLWDMEKFFDTVHLDDVRRLGVQRQYPASELRLAISMHRAPRLMQMIGIAANVILPARSLIQGCYHSGLFARLVMWRPVERASEDVDDIRVVNRQVARVKAGTFVDDVSQVSIGTRSAVAQALTIAGISFAASIRQFQLIISCKSLVIASDLQLAKLISCTIRKEAKVSLSPCTSARDLGVLLTAKAKRNTSLQANRLNKAVGRLKRIAPLAKSLRAARKLICTGALPQCLWGSSAQAFAPSRIKMLTTAAAAACGIGGRGRCASTALAISLGPAKHPLAQALCRQASVWIDVWRSDPQIRALTARHWNAIVARVISPTGQVQWPSVCSTLSGTIATFYQNNWTMESPIAWIDPNGKRWEADFTAPKAPFLDIVRGHAVERIWRDAALFEHGRGLQSGVHWQSTLKLHKRLTGSSAMCHDDDDYTAMEDQQQEQWPPAAASWLELFLTAGYWTNERVHRAQPSASAACPRCGYHTEDAFHLLWSCPKNRLILDEKVTSTQALLEQARDGVGEHPCLWLRGILPMDLLHINKPFPDTSELILVCKYVAPFQWPSGSYHCDASGGAHNAFPLIRRCGFGIVLISPHFTAALATSATCPSQLIQFGAYGALPGSKQTVPRAELFAIFMIVENLAHGTRACITTDSKINVDLHDKGRQHATDSVNGDLWFHIYESIDSKELDIVIRWSKGHPTVDLALKYKITPESAIGNIFADALAGRAADMHAVFSDDSFGALWHFELVTKIQKRAIVILSLLANRQASFFKNAPKPALQPALLPITGEVLQSQHKFAAFGRTLHCFACQGHSPVGMAATREWLRSPCRPNVKLASTYVAGAVKPSRLPSDAILKIGKQQVHPSHTIMVFKGLHFCRRCASWASKRLLNLSRPCDPAGRSSEEAHRIRLRAQSLLQGQLPRGLTYWPNDAARVSLDTD